MARINFIVLSALTVLSRAGSPACMQSHLDQNQLVQQNILAVIAKHNQDDENQGAHVEALSPGLDDDLLACGSARPGIG